MICIDKSADWTSFDVVAKTRGITRCRSVGHGGTLDPMATGVLPLFLGRATRASALLPDTDKRYTAGFRLGLATDTQDTTGRVVQSSEKPVTAQELERALAAFRGEIDQLPPMYSAVQVDGRRLYDLARKGIEVERQPRRITIDRLELMEYDPTERSGMLDIRCSKGTYIRTLINDVGASLGCYGAMSSLRRTEALGFTLSDCVTLAELADIAASGELESRLLPVEKAFEPYPPLYLDEVQTRLFLNGARLDISRVDYPAADRPLRVYGGGAFLGLARAESESGELVIIRQFYHR